MKRDTIETQRVPFLLDDVLSELRAVIWCTASQLALLGRNDLAQTLVGSSTEFGSIENPDGFVSDLYLDIIPITETIRRSYDFAFQVNNPNLFSKADWIVLRAFISGSVRGSWSGMQSPLMIENSKLLHVADMVDGRMALLTGHALSIRQLSLLANMVVPSVRSSLSEEGIKTVGRPAGLPAVKALKWLLTRRGFVETSEGAAFNHVASDYTIFELKPFPDAIRDLVARYRLQPAGNDAPLIDFAFADRLGMGEDRNAGIRDIVRLAKGLSLNPDFLVDAYLNYIITES